VKTFLRPLCVPPGLRLAAMAAFIIISSASTRAAFMGSDNAGNYGNAWAGNGGTGFGDWSFSNTSGNGSQNGSFLATSSGNSDLSIATSGKGWGLYANSGQTANAIRTLTGGNLVAGQSFSLRMDNGNVNSGGSVGFSLRNSAQQNRFEFYFVGGQNNYKININGTETDTGVGFTSGGLNLIFTQNGANGYTFSINGSTPLTGALSASDISEIRFFDFNSGGGNNVYFNDLAVVPEPTNIALGIFGAVGGLGGLVRWGARMKSRVQN